MVKLRLLRVGRHKLSSFRIVASDSKSKANGAYIENLGHYDPIQEKNTTLKELNIIKWLANGAQPTNTVKSLLSKNGIWAKFTTLKSKKELEKYLEENLEQKKVIKNEIAKNKKIANEDKIIKVEKTKQTSKKEKEEELIIKKESKFVNKYSEEEILKRESEVLTVAEESEMEDSTSPKTIMISLEKKYVENIINEEKEFVFLKRLPIQPVNRVLIYIVKPIGKVVGEFDLKSTQTLSKTKAWREYGKNSIFTKKEFDIYFESSEDVKMMEISGFIHYRKPKELEQYKLSKGPSGFTYLK